MVPKINRFDRIDHLPEERGMGKFPNIGLSKPQCDPGQ